MGRDTTWDTADDEAAIAVLLVVAVSEFETRVPSCAVPDSTVMLYFQQLRAIRYFCLTSPLR